MDIVISTALTVVSIAMAYLGVHVTLHPPNESSHARFWYKAGFFVCGVVAVSLVSTQGIRGRNSQRSAANQIEALRQDVKAARTEAQNANQEVQGESSRRQQAERDLAIIIQSSGRATREGIAQDLRKIPLKVEVNGQPIQDLGEKKRIREALGNYMQRGMDLRDRCATDVPEKELEAEAQGWFGDVQQYLRQNLDSSYLNQFLLTHPDPLTPGGVRQEMLPLWHGLNQRTQNLNRFIDQLK